MQKWFINQNQLWADWAVLKGIFKLFRSIPNRWSCCYCLPWAQVLLNL